ncbi:MAG: DNA cytosine methyltransferase [Candidatus Margulisiibacteriota bacterium]
MARSKLRAIDFFCGAGGMTFGMSSAGIDVIAGIDIDPECKGTYEANNPSSKYILRDITQMKVEELAESIRIKKNDKNMVFIGCSPCQYWTRLVTSKKKSEKSKNLLMDFLRFVEYYMPGYIVVENVPGIFKKSATSNLPFFLEAINRMGYSVDYKIINSRNCGVPQNRVRFLLVASRVRAKITIPEFNNSEYAKVKYFIGVHNNFPKIKAGTKDLTDFMHTTTRLSETNIRRLKCTPKNGGNRLSWKDDPELQIPAYCGKDNTFRDTYGRLSWDKPSSTITTKFISISNGRFAHPEENRGLSLREGATLQTFPRGYKFIGSSVVTIARQIGNAVPPMLSRIIANVIVNE